jgi:trigger factor
MDVQVETIATCKKRLSITIPREEIDAKFDERFTELENEAFVPGFRVGHAPRRLIEKRFRDAVAEEVRLKLVSEAFEKALQEQELDVVGDPDVDPEKIELPDEGPMTFSVDLEVRPEFELPEDTTTIPVDEVERPEVSDESVAEALERLREQNGRLETAGADEPAGERDLVVADLTIQAGDVMVVDRQNVRLPVRQVAIDGIRLDELPGLLTGAKAGDTKETTITIGQDADNEDVRGKEAHLAVKVNEVQRLKVPTDDELLQATDYEDMEALRGAIRRQQESRSEAQFREAQEEAVRNWLLQEIPFDLPQDLVSRHANRLLQRRLMALQYRGVPADELEQHMDEIAGATSDQAARDLRLHFILDAVAKAEGIEVTDTEVDARVRFMAVQYGRKADRLREEMEASGHLDSLRGQILEDKVIRTLLDRATGAAAPGPAAEAAEDEGEAAAPEGEPSGQAAEGEGQAAEGEAPAEEAAGEGPDEST